MPEAYLIGPDGHVSARIELVGDDEDTAKERARSLVDGLDVELWEGARRIEIYRRID